MVLAVAAVMAFFAYAFTAGYGAGHVEQNFGTARNITPPPSTLDIIYERTADNTQDFIHLKIDTSYSCRGKGLFRMQTTCMRSMALREFDGAYRHSDIPPAACFVANNGATPTIWDDTGATRQIMGYDCRCARASFNGRTWEVWYTDRLPHRAAGTVSADGIEGLILEAYDMQSEQHYSLKARYISERIG